MKLLAIRGEELSEGVGALLINICEGGAADALRSVVECDLDRSPARPDEQSLLALAARSGSVLGVEYLLRRGATDPKLTVRHRNQF